MLKLILLKLNYLRHQQHQPQVVYTTLGWLNAVAMVATKQYCILH